MKAAETLTLTGRIALVTGGARNIGLAIARKFAASGMKVALLSVSEGSAEAAAWSIHPSTDFALGLRCDVSDAARDMSVRSCLARCS